MYQKAGLADQSLELKFTVLHVLIWLRWAAQLLLWWWCRSSGCARGGKYDMITDTLSPNIPLQILPVNRQENDNESTRKSENFAAKIALSWSWPLYIEQSYRTCHICQMEGPRKKITTI